MAVGLVPDWLSLVIVLLPNRFPTTGNTQEIIDLLGLLQTNYSSNIPDWMKNYSLPYNITVQGNLAPAGAEELVAYGERSRASVGSSFPTTYNASLFKLAHTYKSRTADSAIAYERLVSATTLWFASTFFDNPDDVEYIEYSSDSCRLHCKQDLLLRFFDMCDRYNEEVVDNSTAMPELDAYDVSSKINDSIAFMKAQLNLPDDASLSLTDVQAAFSACAFDVTLYDITDNWCSLVDQEFLNRMEYAEDIESFYEQGAGYKINYEIAAVLLQDIYAYMKNFTTGDTTIVGNLRFGHAETTLPLMTLLGYGDRTPLLASWTDEQINSRGFRTSALAAMASNIDFRLYQGKTDQKYYVSVWIQEIQAALPGCDDELYCELSKVEELWDYYLNDYDFDAECAV
ncbi:hypothetical protein BBJ28_00009604 [Nothophytophthora sp. Chile5]|nr:hypothetical protein BBJ28_00009604 [Nothophytophthora sp. Chile5]